MLLPLLIGYNMVGDGDSENCRDLSERLLKYGFGAYISTAHSDTSTSDMTAVLWY